MRANRLLASLSPIKLRQDAPSVALVIDVGQQIERLDDAPQFDQRSCQSGWLIAPLQRPHQRFDVIHAQRRRPGQTQQFIPVLCNQRQIDRMTRQVLECPIVCLAVNTPEACPTRIGDTRTELCDLTHNVAVSAKIWVKLDKVLL